MGRGEKGFVVFKRENERSGMTKSGKEENEVKRNGIE